MHQQREKPTDKRSGSLISKLVVLVIILAVVVFVGGKFFGIGICEKILKMVGL